MIIWNILKELKLPYILLLLCGYTLTTSNNIYFTILLCVVMLPIMLIWRSLWDRNATVLSVWGASYFLITAFYYAPNSWANEIAYLLAPVSFYFCGKLFVRKLVTQNNLLWMILIFCIVTSLPLYILTIIDVANGELIAYSRRLGNEEVVLAATLYGLVAAITLSGLGFFITATNSTPKYVKIGFLVLFGGSLLTTIHLINRTGIVIAIVCLCAAIIMRGSKNIMKSAIMLIIVLGAVFLYFGTDWLMEAVKAYTYRNDTSLGIDTGGGRFDRWWDALGKFIFYPLGWWQNNSTYNAQVHNLWLDIARVAGILPFFLIILFFIRGLHTQIKLIKYYKLQPVVQLTFGLLLSMCLAASVEPVIEAKVSYFCLILFFIGLESGIYNMRKTILTSKL